MVLTTSETTTTRVLTVLPYTTVTSRDMTAVFAGFAKMGRHGLNKTETEDQRESISSEYRFQVEYCIRLSERDPALRHTIAAPNHSYKLLEGSRIRRHANWGPE